DMRALQRYSAALMRAAVARLPAGRYRASDVLDDDGVGGERLRIAVTITIARGRARVDFAGSAPQTAGPLNANFAVTRSATLYVFAALAGGEVPPNEGLAAPLTIVAPEGSIVNAMYPAAVAGGNVETSQRIVDVLLRARARASGVHTHMTNTMNTPIEALEAYYPLRVRRYALRRGSGGRGRQPGGDGIVRELEFLSEAQVTLLGERRVVPPWGLRGGDAGA